MILARNYMCSLMMISDMLSKHVGAMKSVLKKWFKINDIQLVHLLVVWYLVNLQDARCNNKDIFSLFAMFIFWIIFHTCHENMVKTYMYLGTEFCIHMSHGSLVFIMKESSRKHLHACHFVISHSTKILLKKTRHIFSKIISKSSSKWC